RKSPSPRLRGSHKAETRIAGFSWRLLLGLTRPQSGWLDNDAFPAAGCRGGLHRAGEGVQPKRTSADGVDVQEPCARQIDETHERILRVHEVPEDLEIVQHHFEIG